MQNAHLNFTWTHDTAEGSNGRRRQCGAPNASHSFGWALLFAAAQYSEVNTSHFEWDEIVIKPYNFNCYTLPNAVKPLVPRYWTNSMRCGRSVLSFIYFFLFYFSVHFHLIRLFVFSSCMSFSTNCLGAGLKQYANEACISQFVVHCAWSLSILCRSQCACVEHGWW